MAPCVAVAPPTRAEATVEGARRESHGGRPRRRRRSSDHATTDRCRGRQVGSPNGNGQDQIFGSSPSLFRNLTALCADVLGAASANVELNLHAITSFHSSFIGRKD